MPRPGGFHVAPLWLVVVALLAGALGAAAGASLVSGVTPVDVARAVIGWYETRTSPATTLAEARTRLVDSVLLKLRVTELDAPVHAESGPGGGMTGFGDAALIVGYRGTVFRFDGDGLGVADIGVPENGLAAYMAKASQRYSAGEHAPQYLRYNDLLHFDDGSRAGLALSYIQWFDDEDCYANVIDVAGLPPGPVDPATVTLRPGDWHRIYRSQPCVPLTDSWPVLNGLLMGGRMVYAGDGTILMASGQGQTQMSPQQPTDYGRVLAISLDGGPARAIATGLRNPQGLLRDSRGRLWTVEHGLYGGDELNLIRPGANYGWPLVSYGTHYSRRPIATARPFGRHDGYEAPAFAWVPSVAPSNLAEARGFDPAWDGDLLIATLAGKALLRARLEGDRVAYVESIPLGKRLRYVQQQPDGRLLVWTDDAKLLVIQAAPLVDEGRAVDQALADAGLPDALAARVAPVLRRCLECHGVAAGGNAPALAGVVGRDVAKVAGYRYGDGLRALGGRWSRDRLKAFLRDPAALAPGTAMPATGLADGPLLDGLVEALARLQPAKG